MDQHAIYGVTSIGRPLDKSFATNRAVSRLMPVGGVIAGVVALMRGDAGLQVSWAFVAGILLVFGAWALARELAPDDNPAAFVSMALAFVVLPLIVPLSFLVLFTTMFLVRIVNRTVGLPARVTDSLVVTGLVFAVVYLTKSPLFGAVAALAFALDASLENRLRGQWAFAVLCLCGVGVSLMLLDVEMGAPSFVSAGVAVLLVVIVLAYLVTLLQTRVLESRGDVTGDRLAVSRVRAGMLIALLVALQALSLGEPGLAHAPIVWMTMAGVSATAVVIRLRKKSTL
jgi:hypothetical protein